MFGYSKISQHVVLDDDGRLMPKVSFPKRFV